jgi:CubicO group peptidase (beta-lactamase class C family)
VWSVTKSVISALIGIAIGEHLISGVDATLAELLPQYAAVMTPGVRRITLKHLLTMTGGFADITDEILLSGDWVRAILAAPEAKPDSAFRYSDASAHLLSAIVSTASGMPTAEYA